MSHSLSPYDHAGYTPSLGSTPPSSLIPLLGISTHSTAAGLAPTLTLVSTSTPLASSGAPLPAASSILPPALSLGLAADAGPNIPGCPPIPAKLLQKILAREYIDLSSLLPEQLRTAESCTSSSSNVVILPESAYEVHKRKRKQISDIATWVQVYSTYMLILLTKYPDQVTELIAYQLLIVQHSRKFEYPSWLHYDIDFRQWAAATKCTSWSQIHPQLYAFAFTAHGKGSSWCPICHTDGGSHSFDCPKFQAIGLDPTPQHRLSLLPHPSTFPKPLRSTFPQPPAKRPKLDYCILFNKYNGKCPYDPCKFPHKCSACLQPGHSFRSCPTKPPAATPPSS